MTQEEKERIDYEIEAKRKARIKELSEWVAAVSFILVIFIIIAILARCSS